MIETDPDEAETRIAAMADSMAAAPLPERMYFDLLRLKVMAYTYHEYTSDSIAVRLVRYYEDEDDEGDEYLDDDDFEFEFLNMDDKDL